MPRRPGTRSTRHPEEGQPEVNLRVSIEHAPGLGGAREKWVLFLLDLLRRHSPDVQKEEDRLA